MIPYRPLGVTGFDVSVVSLGGAAIGQQYGPITQQQVDEVITFAIDAGINLIDTSAYYGEGESERLIGHALQRNHLKQKISICTKAGRLSYDHFDFSASGIRESFEASLRRLQVDHVDILLAHDIEFAEDLTQVFTETAEELHRLKQQGKVRWIGMSGLPLSVLRKAIEYCSLDVVMSYCHYTLFDNTLALDLLPVANEYKVGVMNASPLAMGLLTNQGPPNWHPASLAIRTVCREAASLCKQHAADIAELGLQYCLAHPGIATTITGTAKVEELRSNLAAVATPINQQLLATVQAALQPIRNQTWSSGRHRKS